MLAGVFVHEAFGHLSEADNVAENEKLQELMVLGKQFGAKHLNVVDGATIPGLRGSYAYDEEGTRPREPTSYGRGNSSAGSTRVKRPPAWAKRPPATHGPSPTLIHPSSA